MPRDTESAASTIARLAPLFPVIAEALERGIETSEKIHADYGWSVAADKHLAYQLVRRVAVEWLKPHTEASGESESLGLPMSGLVLKVGGDVIRVWHSNDGSLPRVDTEAMRIYCSQKPLDQDGLFDYGTHLSGSNLAILWHAQDRALNRFELVRPAGASGPIAHVDWRVNLISWATSADAADIDSDDDDPE